MGTHDSFCAAKIHTGAPEKGTYGNWKRNPKQPPECQRSGKGPADPFTSHNNQRLWPPQTREGADQRCRTKTGFFSAGPGKPAHLARLIVMAGDVEENPGPYECGICQKRVSGCSIKCTWCIEWIHQVCSEMTRGQIRQIAGKERYAFECRKCREPSKTTGTIVPGTPEETFPRALRSQLEQRDLTESAGGSEDTRQKITRKRAEGKKRQYKKTEEPNAPNTNPKKQGE